MAGCANGEGYYQVKVTLAPRQYKTIRCAKIVYEMHHDVEVSHSLHVDHWDGNPSNNAIGNLRLVTIAVNMRNKKKPNNNTTGVVGVYWVKKNRHHGDRWVAMWTELSGKRRMKCFFVAIHGESAFRLACKHREQQIKELNMQGAGYTEDHGVRE